VFVGSRPSASEAPGRRTARLATGAEAEVLELEEDHAGVVVVELGAVDVAGADTSVAQSVRARRCVLPVAYSSSGM
jgi:hypothetical protein